MTERIFAVARKELIQLRRDPRSLTLAFGLPVLLVLLFGYAVSFDVKDIRLAILDEDKTSTSRELIDAFRETKVFRELGAISRRADADRLLTQGKAQMVIIIPQGFAADAAARNARAGAPRGAAVGVRFRAPLDRAPRRRRRPG